MRADVLHRGSQGMLQYTRVLPHPPRTAPPSLLLLRFNEMLRPLARDYFPIAPINSPFGTPFLPGGPWGRLLWLLDED